MGCACISEGFCNYEGGEEDGAWWERLGTFRKVDALPTDGPLMDVQVVRTFSLAIHITTPSGPRRIQIRSLLDTRDHTKLSLV